jgi:hypothetical protein
MNSHIKEKIEQLADFLNELELQEVRDINEALELIAENMLETSGDEHYKKMAVKQIELAMHHYIRAREV